MKWKEIAAGFEQLIFLGGLTETLFMRYSWRSAFGIPECPLNLGAMEKWADDPAWVDYALFLEGVLGIGD